MSKDFILNVQNNNVLRITSFGIEHIDRAPCLILVHGFKGFKDWGFGPYVGDYFSKKGFFVLTFNFSHNGVGDSLTEFVELDEFAENTFSLEMDELKELILAYDFGFFGDSSNKGIGLIGHSRGGAISLLVGAESDERITYFFLFVFGLLTIFLIGQLSLLILYRYISVKYLKDKSS